MLGLHTFRQKEAGVVKRKTRNSDSVVWTDLLGFIRHLFPLSDFFLFVQGRGLRLSEDSAA